MSESGGETPRRRRRWLRRAGWAVLAAGGCAAAALGTGAPQRWALVRGIEAGLPGSAVSAEGVSIAGLFSTERLTIGDAGEAPAIAVEGLRAAYAPFGARWIPLVEAASVRLTLDARDPANTSYDFLVRALTPKAEPSAPILPQAIPARIRVLAADLSYASAPMSASIAGVGLDMTLASLDAFEAAIAAYGVSGSYRMADPPVDRRFTDGRIDLRGTASGGTYRLDPMTVHLPGMVDWEGAASFAAAGGGLRFEADLRRAELSGLDFSGAASGLLPAPFRFTRADFSGTRVRGEAERGVIALGESRIAGTVEGLYVGAPGARLYEGDLRVDGAASDGTAAITAVLGQGQALRLDAQGGVANGAGTVALSNWTREQLAGALPEFAAPWLAYAPTLEGLSASADIQWDDGAVTAEALGEAAFTGGGDRLNAAVTVRMPRDDGAATVLRGEGTLGSSGFVGEASFENGAIDAAADLTGFDVAGAARILGLPEAVRDIETVVTGRVEAAGAGPYSLKADIRAKPAPYIAYPLPEGESLALEGAGSYDASAGELRSSAMALRLGSDAALSLRSLTLRPTPLHVTAAGSFTGDLGAIAGRYTLGPLSGSAEAEIEATVRGDSVEAKAEFSVDGLGYGTTGLPFDAPLQGSLEADYGLSVRHGAVTATAATADGGTEAALRDGSFDVARSFTAAGALTVRSDLAVARQLGLVADADGAATLTGQAGYGPAGLTLDEGTVGLEAFVIELLDKAARLSGLAFEGTGGYGPGRTLTGRFGAARLEAAGAVLTDVFGTAAYGAEGVRLALERGELYDGSIHKGVVTIRFDDDGTTVVEGDVEFREADLAVFTEEFKPPSTRLTGLLSGAVSFTFRNGALISAGIRARAPEGFSVNKDLIREQLLKQTINDATLGILFSESDGAADTGQREFDHAALEMRYDPERNLLAGEARMVSEELRLTMPMTVDMRVITEGLRFRQERHLEEVEDVRLVPVDLGE